MGDQLRIANLESRTSKILSLGPEKITVDLGGPNQVFELLEPRERPKLKRFSRHIDTSKKVEQLLSSPPGIPLTLECRKMFPNLLK